MTRTTACDDTCRFIPGRSTIAHSDNCSERRNREAMPHQTAAALIAEWIDDATAVHAAMMPRTTLATLLNHSIATAQTLHNIVTAEAPMQPRTPREIASSRFTDEFYTRWPGVVLRATIVPPYTLLRDDGAPFSDKQAAFIDGYNAAVSAL